jgi:hypothetical protein
MSKDYDVALRPLRDPDMPHNWLDDIVVEDCTMHLEQMNTNCWVLMCHLKKGGTINFGILPNENGLKVQVNWVEDFENVVYEEGSLDAEKLSRDELYDVPKDGTPYVTDYGVTIRMLGGSKPAPKQRKANRKEGV